MVTIQFAGSIVLIIVGALVVAAMPQPQSEQSSVTPVGIAAYRRFHANDSHIGKPIPCTLQEKACFRYNVPLMKLTGFLEMCSTYTYGICNLVGDRNEFLYGSGHLIEECDKTGDPCPGYRMAFDGRCYTKEIVRDVICGCDAEPTQYFLGGMECRCSPPTRIEVQQPVEDGKCLIPDLRFPDTRHRFLQFVHPFEGSIVALNCSADQAICFSMDKVWMEGGRGCFSLWERGPCPVEHLVVLDGQAALQGRAEGVCLHERGGCPQGQRRMAFDQRCYQDADLEVIMIGGMVLTEYGNRMWSGLGNYISSFLERDQNQCIIKHQRGGSLGAQHWALPPCGDNNRNICELFEVESQPPIPSFD